MFPFLKPFLAVSLLLLPGPNQKPPKNPTSSADIKELTRLERVWNEAQLNGDTDVLDRLWADDLVITVPNMPLMDKTESLESVRSAKMKFRTYKTSDIKIHVYHDAAVVTGQLERTRNTRQDGLEDDWRFTKVYVRRSGKWLVVAWHGSPVGN